MELTLIADSGSSKTSWAGIADDKVVFSFETAGLNPNFTSENDFRKEIDLLKQQLDVKYSVREIYFYGSGCSSLKNQQVVQNILNKILGTKKITVDSDLMGAGLALSGKEKSIVTILGTGSNACLFDNGKIEFAVPSFGYIFGDYGSGAAIGKDTLQHSLDGDFSGELNKEFRKWLVLSDDEVVQRVYKESRPNRFLASIILFHAKHPDNSSLRKIRLNSFNRFFTIQVSQIPYAKKYKVNFCGSVAYFFKEEIEFIASENGIQCGKFIQSPIELLTAYFIHK
jgi:N-acetylglucosamine kinase-like BadF-type ATPase